jgi:DNA-binding transcriptional ArsR family regulator
MEYGLRKEVLVDYQWLAKMFRALGNPVRVKILTHLAKDLYVSAISFAAPATARLMFRSS